MKPKIKGMCKTVFKMNHLYFIIISFSAQFSFSKYVLYIGTYINLHIPITMFWRFTSDSKDQNEAASIGNHWRVTISPCRSRSKMGTRSYTILYLFVIYLEEVLLWAAENMLKYSYKNKRNFAVHNNINKPCLIEEFPNKMDYVCNFRRMYTEYTMKKCY